MAGNAVSNDLTLQISFVDWFWHITFMVPYFPVGARFTCRPSLTLHHRNCTICLLASECATICEYEQSSCPLQYNNQTSNYDLNSCNCQTGFISATCSPGIRRIEQYCDFVVNSLKVIQRCSTSLALQNVSARTAVFILARNWIASTQTWQCRPAAYPQMRRSCG